MRGEGRYWGGGRGGGRGAVSAGTRNQHNTNTTTPTQQHKHNNTNTTTKRLLSRAHEQVDGCIGALFLDLLSSSGAFTAAEVADVVDIGYLNGLFVLARSIGLIGHALDQKRLQQPLYRHPWEDVLYTS